jgi:DNA-binding transcriptional MerR regulator
MQTIKQVSEQFNVTYDTLRYYEKIGLLPTQPRKKSALS